MHIPMTRDESLNWSNRESSDTAGRNVYKGMYETTKTVAAHPINLAALRSTTVLSLMSYKLFMRGSFFQTKRKAGDDESSHLRTSETARASDIAAPDDGEGIQPR
jgi:hypothetical protein